MVSIADKASSGQSWIVGEEDAALPSWLRAGSHDLCWYFFPEVKGYSPSHYTVGWSLGRVLGDDQSPHEDYWRGIGQRIVVAYVESLDSAAKRVTTIVNFARAVRSLVGWACWERKCSALSQFSKDDLQAYEGYIETLGLTRGHVEIRLGVMRTLWLLRDHLPEAIGFAPYRGRGELKRATKRLGRPDGRTATLKPAYFFRLLDHALSVLESGEVWVERGEAYAQFRENIERPSRKAPSLGVSAQTILDKNRELYGSCAVVVLSLLAPRKHEIANYVIGDARRLIEDDAGGILSGRVTKSSNGSGGRETERPVIPELKKAIELVMRIVGASDSNDEDALFRTSLLDSYRTKHIGEPLDTGQIYRLIEFSAKCAGVPIKVRPHMFRRAFSMIYMWRYEFGDLAHLSRFLHHNDLKHTVAYVSGDDIREFMSDAEKELGRSIMERALVGKEAFGGGFGGWLERFARRLRARVSVIRPEHVEDWIQARVSDESFSIKPGPHGYCVIFRDRGAKAACSTGGNAPNYGNRTDQHCACCGNFLLTSRSVGYWEASLDAHGRVLKSSRIKVMKAAAKEAVDAAKRMLASFRGSSE